jgi:hypothetical protein
VRARHFASFHPQTALTHTEKWIEFLYGQLQFNLTDVLYLTGVSVLLWQTRNVAAEYPDDEPVLCLRFFSRTQSACNGLVIYLIDESHSLNNMQI